VLFQWLLLWLGFKAMESDSIQWQFASGSPHFLYCIGEEVPWNGKAGSTIPNPSASSNQQNGTPKHSKIRRKSDSAVSLLVYDTCHSCEQLAYRKSANWNCCTEALHSINPLMPELNPSTQHFLMRFFTGDFASWTINICMKNQQIHQLFIQFINYVW
jgi:hypothetical protein